MLRMILVMHLINNNVINVERMDRVLSESSVSFSSLSLPPADEVTATTVRT